jgi:hypothetical protein
MAPQITPEVVAPAFSDSTGSTGWAGDKLYKMGKNADHLKKILNHILFAEHTLVPKEHNIVMCIWKVFEVFDTSLLWQIPAIKLMLAHAKISPRRHMPTFQKVLEEAEIQDGFAVDVSVKFWVHNVCISGLGSVSPSQHLPLLWLITHLSC